MLISSKDIDFEEDDEFFNYDMNESIFVYRLFPLFTLVLSFIIFRVEFH